MESITKYIKPEDDYFFQKSEEKQKRLFVINLLKMTNHTTAEIAALADVPTDFVNQIRRELTA